MNERYFSFFNGTMVSRRHRGELEPPLLRDLKNMYISTSDSSPTVAGDQVRYRDDLFAFTSVFGGNYTDKTDWLNTVVFSPKDEEYMYINRCVPWYHSSGTATILSSTYTTGTVTNSAGSAAVVGSGTSWKQNASVGNYLQFDGETDWYRVSSVTDDTHISVDGAPGAHTGSAYTIMQTHDLENARYPAHVENFYNGIVYSMTDPTKYNSPSTIYGPFYQSITTAGLSGNTTPLSTSYRANGFAAADGQVYLLGTREYSGGSWSYYPYRIRWTAPGSYNDFSSAGSGYQDMSGVGYLIDGRTLDNMIVVFESSGITTLNLNGDLDYPFDPLRISDKIRILSNPVVVDNMIYFVGSNGILYMTNGVTISTHGSPFDISEYTDFDSTTPVQIVYDESIKSLIIYRPIDGIENRIFIVSIETGRVGSIIPVTIPATIGYRFPRSVVQIVSPEDPDAAIPLYPSL